MVSKDGSPWIIKEKISKKLLFAKYLETDTKGETLFIELKRFLDIKAIIPLTNIISFITDGALAMVGQHQSFLAYLKQIISNVFSEHCVIHRYHLVTKNLSERLHEDLHHKSS